jgi:hypothetical protein
MQPFFFEIKFQCSHVGSDGCHCHGIIFFCSKGITVESWILSSDATKGHGLAAPMGEGGGTVERCGACHDPKIKTTWRKI